MNKLILLLIFLIATPNALLPSDAKLEDELKAIMHLVMKKEAELESQINYLEDEKSAVTKANLQLLQYMKLLRQKSKSLENENRLLRSKLFESGAKSFEVASLSETNNSLTKVSTIPEHSRDFSGPPATDSTSAVQREPKQADQPSAFEPSGALDKNTARDIKLMETSQNALSIFKGKDSQLEEWFEHAYGYVIFPSVGKVGVGFGAAFGKGEVYEDGIFIGEARLTQGSFGLQLGGQAFSEIIFFENRENLQNFKEGVFALSAQTSAVIAAEGAAANARYERGIAVFTAPKGGMMIEASVGGQRFKFIPKEIIPPAPSVAEFGSK